MGAKMGIRDGDREMERKGKREWERGGGVEMGKGMRRGE